jgi:PhzF family phenazine biosynthesis protein
MTSYELLQVDAFTTTPLTGNPCAVLPDAAGLDDEAMLAIAREMNLSETTFVLPAEVPEADYRVRIFTPTGEIPFAGHPTLGTAHTALECGLVKAGGERFTLRQQTLAGVQPIEVVEGPGGRSYTMTQPTPEFAPAAPLEEICAALRVDPAHVVREPLRVSVGVAWHILPLASLEVVRGLSPDMSAHAELEARTGVGTTVFCQEAEDPECSVRLRTFVPGGGIGEDPVCGSGNGCVGAYLAHTGMAPAPLAYVAEQGIECGQPGRAHVQVDEVDGALRVRVGGGVVTLLEGTLTLQG